VWHIDYPADTEFIGHYAGWWREKGLAYGHGRLPPSDQRALT
jgi:hypothetical protein